MKKIFSLMILAVILISIGFVIAGNGNSGSIKTTRSDCITPTNENHYNVGEDVWIKGEKFDSGNYNWEITGKPGGASCDPNVVVDSGNYIVNSSGKFCFNAYTVANNDCGEYNVDFNNKPDNYRVNISTAVPEFGAVVGFLTILSAVGIFFFIRR